MVIQILHPSSTILPPAPLGSSIPKAIPNWALRPTPRANTIRHEYECFRVLEKHGILVPKIYGYCEEPVGFDADIGGKELVGALGDESGADAECGGHRERVTDQRRRESIFNFLPILC